MQVAKIMREVEVRLRDLTFSILDTVECSATKVILTLEQATKAQRGSRRIALPFL